jgi:hypothetical protein
VDQDKQNRDIDDERASGRGSIPGCFPEDGLHVADSADLTVRQS